MNSNGVSSVVAMVLFLALVSLSMAVIWAKYVPFDKRNAEIELNEELETEFLKIPKLYHELRENETKALMMKLGGKKTFTGYLTTTSTLKINKTGNFSIEMNCDNASVTKNYSFFSIELHIYNSFLPERKFVYSNGGLKIFQLGRNFTKIDPFIKDSLNFDVENLTLLLRLDNISTESVEASGSGSAFLSIKYSENKEEYSNCTGSITLNENYFYENWIEKMQQLQGPQINFDPESKELKFSNINVTILIRDFKINLI